MKITLVAQDPNLTHAFLQAFPRHSSVHVLEGDILDVAADAYVSPANSFGFMDGGIDAAYRGRFGSQLERRVQQVIRERFDGELLVGQAFAVPTGDEAVPHLVVAPTMRVPMVIPDAASVRLATRAAVRVALQAGLQHIAMPGMGTGTGSVKYRFAVPMMAAGIQDALGPRQFPKSTAIATEDHWRPYPKADAA